MIAKKLDVHENCNKRTRIGINELTTHRTSQLSGVNDKKSSECNAHRSRKEFRGKTSEYTTYVSKVKTLRASAMYLNSVCASLWKHANNCSVFELFLIHPKVKSLRRIFNCT